MASIAPERFAKNEKEKLGNPGSDRMRPSRRSTWAFTFFLVGGGICVVAAVLLLLTRQGYLQRTKELEELARKGQQNESVEQNEATKNTPEAETKTIGATTQDESATTQATSGYQGEIIQEAVPGAPAVNPFFRLTVLEAKKEETIGETSPLESTDVFDRLRLRIENVSGREQSLIPLAEFFIEDAEGQAFGVAFLNEGDLKDNLDADLTFQSGEIKEGSLAFEVPKDASNTFFVYRPATGAEKDVLHIGPL